MSLGRRLGNKTTLNVKACKFQSTPSQFHKILFYYFVLYSVVHGPDNGTAICLDLSIPTTTVPYYPNKNLSRTIYSQTNKSPGVITRLWVSNKIYRMNFRRFMFSVLISKHRLLASVGNQKDSFWITWFLFFFSRSPFLRFICVDTKTIFLNRLRFS